MLSGRKRGKGASVKIVYLATTGASDPTKASIPMHIAANGSLEVGQEPVIVLAGDAAEIVLGDSLEKIEGLGIPPMRDLVAKLNENAVPFYV
jgi:predicted peroxiredoxin